MTLTKYLPKRSSSRTLHLIDADNTVAGPNSTSEFAIATSAAYRAASEYSPEDSAIVAASHHGTITYGFDFGVQGSRWVMRSGPDGADLALIEEFDWELAHGRPIDRLMLGTGDDIFTEVAQRAGAAGAYVIVIGRRGAISRRLRMAAHEVRYLDDYVGMAA